MNQAEKRTLLTRRYMAQSTEAGNKIELLAKVHLHDVAFDKLHLCRPRGPLRVDRTALL